MEVLNIKTMSVVKTASLRSTAGLLAWSAAYVAGLIWHVVAPDVSVSATETVSDVQLVSAVMPAANSSIDLDRLRSVFALQAPGQRVVADTQSSIDMTAEQTRLLLTLKGAVLSSDPAYSRAIIASGDSQHGYKPGDSIADMPGSVVLQAVYQSYVLLDNNGRTEILRMDNEQTMPGNPAQSLALPQTDSPGAINITSSPAKKFSGQSFSDLVRIQPVFEAQDSKNAGALRGLQIRHGSRQDFLSAAGLRQGDLITGVNGTSLDNPAQIPQLMQQLSSAQSVTLHVLRDQQVENVHLDRTQW
jgi:general secretion pathway protein C